MNEEAVVRVLLGFRMSLLDSTYVSFRIGGPGDSGLAMQRKRAE